MADDGSNPPSASVPRSTPELLAALQVLHRVDSDEPLRRVLSDEPLDDDAALDVLTAATALPAPAQLDVLSRAVSSARVPNEALHGFAASLVRSGIDKPAHRKAIAATLVERLGPDVAGDPLGRHPGGLTRPRRPLEEINRATTFDPSDVGGMVDLLAPGIANNVWDIQTVSGEATVGGVRVLRIASDLYTRTTLEHLVPMADPRQWTRGPLGDAFFRSIVAPVEPPSLNPPDHGWRATIEETVDFSLGLADADHVFVTDLDVMFWNDVMFPDKDADGDASSTTSSRTDNRSVGMTYRLHPEPGRAAERRHSADPRRAICFDSGYIIIDELVRPTDTVGPGLCRIRTLKEVAFRDGREAPFADLASPIWSWSTCLILDGTDEDQGEGAR